MKKQSSSQKKVVPQWVIYYILFLVIIIFWHIIMREYSGDSVNSYGPAMEQNSLFYLLKNHYKTWSSRIFIEALLYPLSLYPLLWKPLNVLIYALLAYSFLALCHFKNYKLLLGLLLIYPITEMASAGWIATCLNYLWPLAAGTYAVLALDKIYHGKKIRKWEYFTYSLALLFATNTEQSVVLLLCAFFGFGCYYYLYKKGRNHIPLFIFFCLIALGNLIFILTCPGNAARTWSEYQWMHDFGTLSIIDKGVLGVVETMNNRLHGDMIFFIFVFILFAIMILELETLDKNYSKAQKAFLGIASTVPIAFTLSQTVLKTASGTYFAKIPNIFDSISKVNASNWNNFKQYIPFFVYMLLVMAIVIALLNLFDNLDKGLELSGIFLAGLVSRVILGFSPTLYASSTRTYIFFEFMLILIIVRIWDYSENVREKSPKILKNAVSWGFGIIVVMSILNNTISICARY